MFGCAGVGAAPGCLAGSASGDPDADQTRLAETEGAITSNSIGAFHLIRLVNTQLCVQPQGGSTGDVPVELHQCDPSAGAQNWLFAQKTSSDFEIVNQQSGRCLYNHSDTPTNGAQVTHEGCNIFGTDRPASNAQWKPSTLTGTATLMSRLQGRDSGVCLDVPGGNAFDTATLQTFHCNGTAAQQWIVGVE